MGLHLLQLILSFITYPQLITRVAELLLSPSVPDIPPPLISKSRSDSLSSDKLLASTRIRFKSVDAQIEDQKIPFSTDNELDPVNEKRSPDTNADSEAVTPRDSEAFSEIEVRRPCRSDSRLPEGYSTETIEFNTDDNGFRAMLYALLIHGDERYKTQAAFILYSILCNENVDEKVLERANFSPQSFRVKKRILAASRKGDSEYDKNENESKAVKYDYPFKAVENILKMMQMARNPLRLVTMDVCSQILLKLLYDEKESARLAIEHEQLLDSAYQTIVHKLKQLLKEKGFDLIKLLENEWNKFRCRRGFNIENVVTTVFYYLIYRQIYYYL